MKMPDIQIGDIIKIGDCSNFNAPNAEVVRIYTDEEKSLGLCGDIEVVYWQNKLKGIREDAVWNEENWKFKSDGPGGSYVNIDHYNPKLKS